MKKNRYLVKPGSRVDLTDYDTRDDGGMTKAEGREALANLQERLTDLQEQLYATDKHALLIVLQGLDAAGKGGVIKNGLSGLSPQGTRVTNFKVPTEEELAHDFLWRVHKAVPGRGQVGIFDRSHYEDVLVVRVEELVPKHVWSRRYDMINDFERLLTENGVVMVKCYLHMSPERQRERLQDRLVNPQDHWKFRVGDLDTRAKWDQYMEAYEAVLTRCNTACAPWYVIPADRKWYRNLVVAQIVTETLESLGMEWPPLEKGPEGIEIPEL